MADSKADKEAFDAGDDAGHADASGEESDSYEEGYIDGVSDARAFPAEADANVAKLCRADEFEDEATFYAEEWSGFDEMDSRFA